MTLNFEEMFHISDQFSWPENIVEQVLLINNAACQIYNSVKEDHSKTIIFGYAFLTISRCLKLLNGRKKLNNILVELQAAIEKHKWPNSIHYQCAVIQEESGEAIQEALNCYVGEGSLQHVETEIMHVIVTCIRFIEHNMEKKGKEKCTVTNQG